jgi:hypothetical protein
MRHLTPFIFLHLSLNLFAQIPIDQILENYRNNKLSFKINESEYSISEHTVVLTLTSEDSLYANLILKKLHLLDHDAMSNDKTYIYPISEKNHIEVNAAHLFLTEYCDPNKIKMIKKELDYKKDFFGLVTKYSEDPKSQIDHGNLGWFKKGVMVAEFEKVAFTTKIGEIGFAKTIFGYHFIKVLDKKNVRENLKYLRIEQKNLSFDTK